MTRTSAPGTIKWAPWLQFGGVGIYPFAEDPTYYRPHQACKMRQLNAPFCAVCAETFVERIHNLVPPVIRPLAGGPTITVRADTCRTGITLSVRTITPAPNTLNYEWRVGATTRPGRSDSLLQIACGTLRAPGATTVQLIVRDTSSLVRTASHAANHLYLIRWQIDRTTDLERQITETRMQMAFRIIENPIRGQIRVETILDEPIRLAWHLIDTQGKTVWAAREAVVSAGTQTYGIDLPALPAGAYRLVAGQGGQPIWDAAVLAQ